MKVYVRVELDEDQLRRLHEKANQPVENLADTPPKVGVNVHEGTNVIESHLVHPEILKVTNESTGPGGELTLEGEVYSTVKHFRISIV